jgi:hypothetical protein
MTRRKTPPDQGDGNFDLSAIFIAREQQLDLFDIYLSRWKRILFDADPDLETPVLASPSPNNKLQGLIVLLYGRGGFAIFGSVPLWIGSSRWRGNAACSILRQGKK